MKEKTNELSAIISKNVKPEATILREAEQINSSTDFFAGLKSIYDSQAQIRSLIQLPTQMKNIEDTLSKFSTINNAALKSITPIQTAVLALNASLSAQIKILSRLDFRIGVLGQQFEKEIQENTEATVNSLTKLSTKSTSKPENDFPEEVLSVLDEYKQIVRDQKDILDELYEARNKDINKKKLNDDQKKTLFLLNWKWYLDVLSSTILSWLIEKVLNQLDPAHVLIVLKYLMQLIHS